MYDKLAGIQSLVEDVLKHAGVATTATYKYCKDRSAVAAYLLSLNALSPAERAKEIHRTLLKVGGDPREGIISALSTLIKTHADILNQPPPVHHPPPSSGLPSFMDPLALMGYPAPATPPPPAPPEEVKKEKPEKEKKKPEKKKDLVVAGDELNQSKIATHNLNTAVMAHLKQVTGLDEKTLLPIATTISTVKIVSPDISADELESIIEDQVLVLEAAGHKVKSLNNPKDTPLQKSYTWEEVDEKLAEALGKTQKYKKLSLGQRRQLAVEVRTRKYTSKTTGEVTSGGIEFEIDKYAAKSGLSLKQRVRLEEDIKRDIVNYLDNTFAGLTNDEKEAALSIGLKNFLLFEAAGKERLRREAGEPATLSRLVSGFNLNAQGEELVLQTILAQAMAAGLNIDQAKIFAQQVFPILKSSYYITGYFNRGFDPKRPTKEQKETFFALNRNLITILAGKSPDPYPVPKDFTMENFSLGAVYSSLVSAYGKPETMPKPDDDIFAAWLGAAQANIIHILPSDLRIMFNEIFNESVFGQNFFRDHPQLQGLRNMFQSSLPPPRFPSLKNYFFDRVRTGQNTAVYRAGRFLANGAAKLGGKAWAKFAATSIGKAVVATGVKIAAKLGIKAAIHAGLQALGSMVPIIGNIIAFVLGEAATWIAEKTIGFVKKFADDLLGIIGLNTSDLLKFGAVAGLAAFATGSLAAGLVIGGSVLLGIAGIAAISAVITAAIILPLIIAILGTPIAIALILYIINSGAVIVPPSHLSYIPGSPVGPGGGGFENRSSCPVPGGYISVYSYNPNSETEHGSNKYWRYTPSEACTLNIPANGSSRAPICSSGCPESNNYCFIQYKCGSNPSNVGCTPFYGLAIDINPTTNSTVYFPLINGQVTTWTYEREIGMRSDGLAGRAYLYSTTDPTTGINYTVAFIHLVQITSPPTNVQSGTVLGTIYPATIFTPHLHLELQVNGVYVRPENYFCGASTISP